MSQEHDVFADDDAALRQELNQQTGKLVWTELEKHFACGAVIKVEGALDLIDVAIAFKKNDTQATVAWLAQGQIARASTDDATRWLEQAPLFWALVVAPWVLVQEVVSSDESLPKNTTVH